MENPIYQSALNGDIAPVCYCYRTVHSVFNYYIFSTLIITSCLTIMAIFFIFGDRFHSEKYRREFEKSGSKENCD